MPEFARICKSMPEYAIGCQRMPEYARVCQSMPEYARVCQSMPEYARECKRMPKYTRVCQSQSCKNVPTVPNSRCYFFWPVLIFGKSTRKTGENTRKHSKTGEKQALFWC